MSGEKAALRKEMQTLRAELGAEARAAKSRSLCAHLGTFLRQRRFKRIGAFWPFRSEVDLRPLFEAHPAVTWFFPRVASTMPPRLIWGGEPLERSTFGLMEPAIAQHFLPPVELLLVPGLAFDPEGFRLGYGGGFYDALLAHLDAGVTTLAIGFGCQRVDELPREALDQPVDGLCTEEGLTWFSPAS
jgi:5-formyltetrahydrofolate cyclo-ligase